jgi:hypothetical protein
MRSSTNNEAREYQVRYSNWLVIVNYLKYFGDFEYVFKCFKFSSKIFSRKYAVLFNKYLQDAQLPKEKMMFSGRHRGGKPSLGFTMDQMVFEFLYEKFLEPNEKLAEHERIKVDNKKINLAIKHILTTAEGNNLIYLTDKKLSVDFQYCKTGCHRFAQRHFFANRFISSPPDGDCFDGRVVLHLSDYAVAKGYPVEGWTIPQSK